MFVETVTAPLRPAWAMTLASRSCCLAFNTWCGMPARFKCSSAIASDFSMEMLPIRMGCGPLAWIWRTPLAFGIVFLQDAVDHGFELFGFGAVDHVGIPSTRISDLFVGI